MPEYILDPMRRSKWAYQQMRNEWPDGPSDEVKATLFLWSFLEYELGAISSQINELKNTISELKKEPA